MGDRYRNCIAMLPLLIVCLCLREVTVIARLVQIRHPVRANSRVTFLAVGDWGRKGGYNQSAVARRVTESEQYTQYITLFKCGMQMGEVGAKLGIDFVISTGDNFYKDGLSGVNDSAFKLSFTNIYSARSLQKPWYTSKSSRVPFMAISNDHELFLNIFLVRLIYIVLGNHDYHGDTEAQLSPLLKKRDKRWNCYRSYIVRAGTISLTTLSFFPLFLGVFYTALVEKTLPYIACSIGLLHIFFVDTNPFVNKYFINRPTNKFNWKGILPRNRYVSTLLKDLNTALKTSNATWKIVVGHHPIRSIGKRGDTIELLQQLLPILQSGIVCSPIQFLTSGGGSRAWGNITHYERYKKNLKFYYDGQGFISVQLTRREANITFYDVFGKTLHSFSLKKYIRSA
ncbi:hypothetical protein BUALT_Bualt07G0095600 [Buddleja alternifolia]|uniref:Calcineurin-like phosphoesterase domain-containing protein n=1 Tax=Buddleja alternifolia TaxID=168488 RepID=A0AAV6XGG1_9LAMI|nr:hypothetical protein BUALT_Bualt07G0095600 [Buddleja alternifolia]